VLRADRTCGVFRNDLGGVALLVAYLLATVGISTPAGASDSSAALTVAVKHIPPFVYVGDQGSFRGFSIDLWDEISKLLNVDSQFVNVSSVGEILDAVEHDQAAVGMAAVTINAEREVRVDFSHPYYRSGLRIAVATSAKASLSASVRRFLSYDLLAMLVMLGGVTLVAAHLLWFTERHVNSECFPKQYLSGVGEALWWSVATIITGGCENKAPVSLLGRVVAVGWMLGSIVLIASFTATLASQMTVEQVSGAIAGPEGLPGRLVSTVAGTSAAADLKEKTVRVRECSDLQAAIRDVMDGKAEAVVFDAPVLAHEITGGNSPKMRLVGPVFEHQDYGIVLPRGSPLRKDVNRAILLLAENGKLAELNIKWFGEKE
jgi:polar amino acid transport system substrate-binding protein